MIRKAEFSKKILVAVGAVTITVTAFALVMMAVTKDLSPLAYLIPAVFAELGVGTGFYYKKAEKENLVKLKKKYGKDVETDEV